MAETFTNDIFISYAHIDNQALIEGESGWVAQFHRALEVRLGQILGAKAKIWRDAKLTGNDVFSDRLLAQFPQVALVISILSPRYVQSEWCIREVDAFRAAAEQTGGLEIDGRSRLLKVVKTHLPLEEQPEIFHPMLGYEFYTLDEGTGRPREFRQDVGANRDTRYWDRLEDLAYDAAQLLKRLKADPPGPAAETSAGETEAPPAPTTMPREERGTIYLAVSTPDLDEPYETIKREFSQRGYNILPAKPLPRTIKELEKEVWHHLKASDLSVHMIGSAYGPFPEGVESSLIDLQNGLAASRCDDPNFRRIIWMPPGLEPAEALQARFIEWLRTHAEAHKGAELLETDLAELKRCMLRMLNRDEPALPVDEAALAHPLVYLVHHPGEAEETAGLQDALFDLGYEVIPPLMCGSEAEADSDHRENLRTSDGVLIYWGGAPESWFRARLREIQRLSADRSRSLLFRGIVLGPPSTAPKERLRVHDLELIKAFGPLTREQLSGLAPRPNRGRDMRS